MQTITMLTTAHDVADARLHRHVDALTRHGIRVSLVGRGRRDHAPAACQQVRILSSGRLRRVAAALALPWFTRGPLFVVDPETMVSAWLSTRLRRQPLIVDLHEDYVAVSRDRAWTRGLVGALARIALRAVYGVARRADLTIVADEHLPPYSARTRLVVRNLPTLGPNTVRDRPCSQQPNAVYIGDVRPSRGLWTMLEAIAAAPGWDLRIIGPLNEVAASDVRRRIERLGIEERVHFHGRQPPEEAWELAAGAWCGLALLEDTPAYHEAIPTKIYEYLAAGLPIIATDLPRVADLIHRSDAGCTVEGAQEAAATLRHWSAYPDDLDRHRRSALDWSEGHLLQAEGSDHLAVAVSTVLAARKART